jgi:RND family efflux transporter MFP subunit
MKDCFVFLVALVFPIMALAADEQAVLQWSNRVELSVPVSGVVRSVNANVGDQVKKGQVLLALDSVMFQAKVSEIQASITRLTAEQAEAKKDLDRVQELYARTVVATAELDQARLRMVRAESMLAEARANLRLQQKNLEDSVLRAPFDGVVISRQAEPGMSVAATMQAQTLLVLGKAGEMTARMYLGAAQIEKLKVGQAVTVVSGGLSYSGTIRVLGLEPVKREGASSYPVDVVFGSREQLRAGVTATVKLP